MFNAKKWSLLTVILCAVLLMSACSGAAAPATSSAPAASASAGSAAAPASSASAGSAAAPAQKTGYTIGTAGSSGAYYIISAAIGKEVDAKSELMNLIVQPTKGSGENLNLVDADEMDFGFGVSSGIYFGYNATGFNEGMEPLDIVGIMSMHNSTAQMMVGKDSGIKTYADLKGKRVCVGTPSAAAYEFCIGIINAYGLNHETDMEPFYLTQDEGAAKLADGDIDATFVLAGHPTAVLTNLAASGDYTLLQADKDILDTLVAESMPYANVITIPAGVYPGTDEDIVTLEQKACIFGRPEVPEEVVYDFVKQTCENWDAIKEGHEALVSLDPAGFADMPIPLHPGAERYFKEAGYLE